MARSELRRITPVKYLAIERWSEARSEYFQGLRLPIPSANRWHGLIKGNLAASLHAQLRGLPCEMFASAMRVGPTVRGPFTYPDLVVVCGEPRFLDEELDTLLNPTVILEVLSPSTADYDRGAKATHYRALPSLSELLYFAQDSVSIEHWIRQTGDQWLFSTLSDPTATVELASIDCSLHLADVYARALGG